MNPFCDLTQRFDSELILPRLSEVLGRRAFINGPQVGELETRLREISGRSHVVTCANGTDALELSLVALGIGPGDSVIVPAYTFNATASAVRNVGASVVFADIDPQTFNVSRETIERALSDKRCTNPKAIIPVDIFGVPWSRAEIVPFARERGLKIVSDSAQSFGSTTSGQSVLGSGDIATTSFFPAKVIGAAGDGGAIFCDDPEIARRLRIIANQGLDPESGQQVERGRNSRLDTAQAAVILSQIESWTDLLQRRVGVANRYENALSELFDFQRVLPGDTTNYAQFTLLVRGEQPDEQVSGFAVRLQDQGESLRRYYRIPLPLQPHYAPLGYSLGDLPGCAEVCTRAFQVPIELGSEATGRLEGIIQALSSRS